MRWAEESARYSQCNGYADHWVAKCRDANVGSVAITDVGPFCFASDETLDARMYSNCWTQWIVEGSKRSISIEVISETEVRRIGLRGMVDGVSRTQKGEVLTLNVGPSRVDTPQRRWEWRRSVLTWVSLQTAHFWAELLEGRRDIRLDHFEPCLHRSAEVHPEVIGKSPEFSEPAMWRRVELLRSFWPFKSDE